MIPLEEAQGPLVAAYEKVKTPHGTVDNVMKAHSLRPHTMEGHVALYRSVLHNPDNTLPFWFLEVVASYVSMHQPLRLQPDPPLRQCTTSDGRSGTRRSGETGPA